MEGSSLDPFMSSPIVWVIGGLVVLGLLWLLFSSLATSDRGSASEEDAHSEAGDSEGGVSGAAWIQKHPDADEGDPGRART